MHFTKMHGIGNDYIFVDCISQPDVLDADLPDLSRRISDRHYGVGSDGLILICLPDDPDTADVRMRMFNADGSEAEMCGNGIRCVAKYVLDEQITEAVPLRVQTAAGVLAIRCEHGGTGEVSAASVEMGRPVLEPQRIPIDPEHLEQIDAARYRVETDAGRFEATFVSMGNPHLVSFVPTSDDLLRISLSTVGPLLEEHPAFPHRMNVHFACAHSEDAALMRTWERGSGLTLACGTGACAVLVAGVRLGLLRRRADLHLPGGVLTVAWSDDDASVIMTGPAVRVCDGIWREAVAVGRV